jgi:hypothetical protein
MPRYLSLGYSLLFLSLRVGIGWAWFRLFSRRQQLTPKWRAGIFVVGLFFATVSTVLSSFLFVHAAFTGGYTFYHPVELLCIRYGALTAFLGILASIAGKGTLRLHLAALSTLNLLIWLADAMAQ